MSVQQSLAEGPLTLGEEATARLERRIDRAVRAARSGIGPAFASVSVPVSDRVDPSAAILGSRLAEEPFACLEQPATGGHAVCALGASTVVEAHGADRFARVAARCRELATRILGDASAPDPGAPAGSGPVFVGGF